MGALEGENGYSSDDLGLSTMEEVLSGRSRVLNGPKGLRKLQEDFLRDPVNGRNSVSGSARSGALAIGASIAASALAAASCGPDREDAQPNTGTMQRALTIEESFALENFRPVPDEIRNNSEFWRTPFPVTPEGRLRWLESTREPPYEDYIREANIEAHPDGTVSIIPPIETITDDPTLIYFSSIRTESGNEFLQFSEDLFRNKFTRNGTVIIDVSASARYSLTDRHIDGENIVLSADMNRPREEPPDPETTDSCDIVRFPEDHSGPPITTMEEFREHATIIPELSPDPVDTAEINCQFSPVFSQNHAYIAQLCRRLNITGCINEDTMDNNTTDTYMLDYNPETETWNSDSMRKIASTDSARETPLSVLDTPNAECLFINAGGENLYACHAKDNDNDDVTNWTDNCVDTPNPDQADVNGNGIGDACEILGFNCNEGTFECSEALDGTFETRGECEASCVPPPRFDCTSGTGECVESDRGEFATLALCDEACDPPVPPDMGNDMPPPVPDMGSDMTPDAGVDAPIPLRFSCNSETGECVESDRGEFETLASCDETCDPPIPPDMGNDMPPPVPDMGSDMTPDAGVDMQMEKPDMGNDSEEPDMQPFSADGGKDTSLPHPPDAGMDSASESDMLRQTEEQPAGDPGCDCVISAKEQGSGSSLAVLGALVMAFVARRKRRLTLKQMSD